MVVFSVFWIGISEVSEPDGTRGTRGTCSSECYKFYIYGLVISRFRKTSVGMTYFLEASSWTTAMMISLSFIISRKISRLLLSARCDGIPGETPW